MKNEITVALLPVKVWAEIVGPECAANSTPVQVSGNALVIETTGSEWSHMLSFLERDIIAGAHVNDLLEVERLRFRIHGVCDGETGPDGKPCYGC